MQGAMSELPKCDIKFYREAFWCTDWYGILSRSNSETLIRQIPPWLIYTKETTGASYVKMASGHDGDSGACGRQVVEARPFDRLWLGAALVLISTCNVSMPFQPHCLLIKQPDHTGSLTVP